MCLRVCVLPMYSQLKGGAWEPLWCRCHIGRSFSLWERAGLGWGHAHTLLICALCRGGGCTFYIYILFMCKVKKEEGKKYAN